MTFIQVEFIGFYLLIFALYWGVRDRRFQNALLAVGSAVFYGWVHPWFLFLLYGSAVLDFFCGQKIRSSPGKAKAFLTLSMAGNLGMLGYFKYADFFIDNVVTSMDMLGAMAKFADDMPL